MNYQLQTTSIVRQRGQLTIPDLIRGRVDWVAPGSVVTVVQMKPNEIIIRPYQAKMGVIDWDGLWRNIELSRSHPGTYTGSLSQFVAQDRESRR